MQTLLFVALQASIFLTVLTIGIRTSGADLRYVHAVVDTLRPGYGRVARV